MMPGESGFETCALLKADPSTVDIPIIFLSALDSSEDRITGLNAGGVDYISKPVHRAEVLVRVRIHLRIREANRIVVQEHKERFQQLTAIQQGILPKPADYPQASFAVFYRPFEAASGDFYDVVVIDPEVIGYFVADISGHGMGAAFFTPALKALLRQHAGPMYSLEDTLGAVDLVMRQVLREEQYLTACYARLNRRTRRLSIVSAGHPPAILLRASGKTEALTVDSEPLGVFSHLEFQPREYKVDLGDRLFLYTDGMIESSPGAGRPEGIGRLMRSADRQRSVPLDEAVANMAADLRSGLNSPQDDLLLLGTEVRP
jgi:sigma-B regulation protein RsbU (phosphoserine phosphatase)